MPASPADPGRPLVPRRPYFVAAGLVALLNGWAFADMLGAGLPGLLIGALYALPVAVSWYRPLTAWWIMLALVGVEPHGLPPAEVGGALAQVHDDVED
ncbi:hypothetical protein AB0K48_43580, partial [Nonomuraea sp. NPDC055795]